jgi:hypothetical protein
VKIHLALHKKYGAQISKKKKKKLISLKDKQGHIVLERLNQHPNNRV